MLTDGRKTISFNELAAQVWVFYAAGFETSSSTMSFCMYELARNIECQRKVQEEIDAISQKYNGAITYDSLNEMKYLESCIDGNIIRFTVKKMCMSLIPNLYRNPSSVSHRSHSQP